MAVEAEAKPTAEDTFQRIGADPSIAPGGHLVAKALEADGVDARHD